MIRALLLVLLVAGPAQANGDSRPARGPVLGSEAFRPAQSGPPQQFRSPPQPQQPQQPQQPLKPLVDPEIDGLVGLVSFEQLRGIIERVQAPEDKRMLQRAFDKLLLLERDRRVYAESVRMLIDGCARMVERNEGRK